jgi:hypothetical protein
VGNANRPTERLRHIDIRHFTIQEWKKAGHLSLKKIQGIINPSDCLTKGVGWVLGSSLAPCSTNDGPLRFYSSILIWTSAVPSFFSFSLSIFSAQASLDLI